MHDDCASVHDEFTSYLRQYDVTVRPVSPSRHHKNMIEPRHGTIISIYIRLRESDYKLSSELRTLQVVRISKDLYGNNIASAFELAKGLSRLVSSFSSINPVPPEIVEAHINLVSKRKLNVIHRTHATPTQSCNVGDLVKAYHKPDKAKSGAWSSPLLVLSVNNEARFVTVPGRSGHSRNVALEDVRLGQHEASFGHAIQRATDELDDSFSDALDRIDVQDDGDTSGTDTGSSEFVDAARSAHDCDFEGVNERITMTGD